MVTRLAQVLQGPSRCRVRHQRRTCSEQPQHQKRPTNLSLTQFTRKHSTTLRTGRAPGLNKRCHEHQDGHSTRIHANVRHCWRTSPEGRTVENCLHEEVAAQRLGQHDQRPQRCPNPSHCVHKHAMSLFKTPFGRRVGLGAGTQAQPASA